MALKTPDTTQHLDDAVVLFDDIQGGLRLTTPLFDGFGALLECLKKGSHLAGEEALLDTSTLELLEQWWTSLSVRDAEALEPTAKFIFAPGSRVAIFANGEISERQISGHQFMSINGSEQLMYSYELDGGLGWASPDSLRPIGTDWSYTSFDEDGRPEERS